MARHGGEGGRRLSAASGVFAAVLAGLVASAHAESTNLSIDEARLVARRAALAGDLQTAEAVALSLLARDPTDAEALLAIAIIERQRGDNDASAKAGQKAFRQSDIPALKFDAAMLVADAAARQKRFTRSQIWLRRADHVAPDEQRRRLAARSYRQIKARNPLQVQLTFAVNPSDNINNGTNDSEQLSTWNGEAPLEGVEAAVSAAVSYRLSEDAKQRTEALGQFYFRKAFISESELDKVRSPTNVVEAEDFDYGLLYVGLQHSRRFTPDMGMSRASIRLGHTYYRQNSYANIVDMSLSQDFELRDDLVLRFGAGVRDETRLEAEIASSTTASVSVTAFGRRESGSWSFGTTFKDISSDSPGVVGQSIEGRLRYAWSAQVLPMATPDVQFSLRGREYPDFFLGERRDTTARASIGLTFDDVRTYGFVPRVEVSYSQTDSNQDAFDSQTSGLGFSLVSRF